MSPTLRDEQHEPTLDAGALVRGECFLCGHKIAPGTGCQFGLDGPLAVLLDCHDDCISTTDSTVVAREYHRRVADLANVRRTA